MNLRSQISFVLFVASISPMFRCFSPPQKWLQSRDYRGPSPRALQCEAEGEQQPLDAFDGGPSVVLISLFLPFLYWLMNNYSNYRVGYFWKCEQTLDIFGTAK